MDYLTNEDIARRIYRAIKTPSDKNRETDPIVSFHFRGREDFVLLRCNKHPELSVKGKDQIAGEVKFFAYSDFSDYDERTVLFGLKADITMIEIYRKGAVEGRTFNSWDEFVRWLDTLDDSGVQISLKLPYLVYHAVKGQKPSMQNFIVEAIKKSLRDKAGGRGED